MIEDDPILLILLCPVSSGRIGAVCAHLVNVVLGTEFRPSCILGRPYTN